VKKERKKKGQKQIRVRKRKNKARKKIRQKTIAKEKKQMWCDRSSVGVVRFIGTRIHH